MARSLHCREKTIIFQNPKQTVSPATWKTLRARKKGKKMQDKKAKKLTRRQAMTRLGVVATAGYIVPGLAGFSAAHASTSSGSSDSSSSSESSTASGESVASVPSNPSLPSLPSDAGITQEQKDIYKACGEGGGSEAECLEEAGITL